jgi:PAS domain-containing protein
VDARAPEDASASAQSLRRFIETVSDTFANLRVGLAIYGPDRRLTLSNPALADLFHADPRWLAARPTLRETLDRLREARQLPEQADYPAWRAALFTLFDNPGRASYQDRWEMPDGRAIQVTGRPHPHGGIAFVFEDVTAAMALQRDAAIMREMQRTALELVSDGVALFGLDGRTRLSNAAFHAMWRLPRREGAPMHVSEVAAACASLAGPDGVWERIRAGVAGGEGRAPWSQRLGLADGRLLDVRVAPMRDGSTLTAFTETRDVGLGPSGLEESRAAWSAAPRTARGGR